MAGIKAGNRCCATGCNIGSHNGTVCIKGVGNFIIDPVPCQIGFTIWIPVEQHISCHAVSICQ
ncbi:hypothetical protein OR1_04135 [Geobacter sp. OR-1]|nr:hypothetical protein OR1_04135 [Geobacter sp. OR-1]